MFEKITKKSYIYFEELKKDEEVSNFVLGSIICSIGLGKRIALIDFDSSLKSFVNFLENFSLNYSFKNYFKTTFISIFNPNKKVDSNLIFTETILPSVEYLNITESMLWEKLNNYDLIIFNGFNESVVSKVKLVSFLRNSPNRIGVLLITSDESSFKGLKGEFLYKRRIVKKSNKSLISKDNLTVVLGDNSSHIYAYGKILNEFINKCSVKIVYFNRSEDFFGDISFFKFLKRWQLSQNNVYGDFDFAVTGTKSLQRGSIIMETKNGLMLLETAVKKRSPVLADDLLSVLDFDSTLLTTTQKILDNVTSNLIITSSIGVFSKDVEKSILNRAGWIVSIEEDRDCEVSTDLDNSKNSLVLD